jgi:hypothetical protein
MKKNASLSVLMAALLGVAPLSLASSHEVPGQENGKTTSREVRREVPDAAEAIKNYSADKRDEAAKKAKTSLDALDVRIAAMEARIDKNWDRMDAAAREQARSTLDALRKQRVQVAEWYGGLKNSTADAWERMKTGFSDSYKSLRHTWEKADRKYGGDDKK